MNKIERAAMYVALAAAAAGPYGHEDRVSISHEPKKEGYAHNGMYSQAKKLRKGAGHRKLTRAQRKKMRF